MKKRVIAINLPQFHPFPENDEWWGKGFTEWTNVTKAKPRFRGHYQPHLPSDTGFYDLRLPEARQMQADMAKEAGIYGFCYYHYWFNGKRLMNRPIDEILASGEPDFPFMFCWANENWARNWAGGFKDVLMAQQYSNEDDINHIRWLCSTAFSDKRYIRIDNKPIFCVYRPHYFPDICKTIKTWRYIAEKEYNIKLYLCYFEAPIYTSGNYMDKGFDAVVDFQPTCIGDFGKNKNILHRLYGKLFPVGKNPFNIIYSYKNYVKYKCNEPMPDYKFYPCVSPGWDNSCRRTASSFMAFIGNTPDLFAKWLDNTINKFSPYAKDEDFVFINAWNEWAEGNHLEPDIKWGRAFLEATKKVISRNNEIL